MIRIDDRSIQVGTNPTRDQCMRLAYRHIVEQDAADALRNTVQEWPGDDGTIAQAEAERLNALIAQGNLFVQIALSCCGETTK